MPKMTAAEAAVLILELEGVKQAFGVPGAAINPFYAALRPRNRIGHILARHVEAASHMAEGYTRAEAGNIGVCIGTSGPAGTDMITGLYSAWADSIPILCITGQAPRARLHKEDFQAVDIESIAKPVTKWAVMAREPGQVPGIFQQAFHLMRSGRPGPVLIDLPFDVQTAEIEFDPDTYQPLPVYKPAASRAQIEKALTMLNAAERPLIVAGGGIINADASDLLVEFAEVTGVPVVPTLMGWGTIPDDHPLMVGMAGLQTSHRYGNATMLASDHRPGHRQPLGQPPHRLSTSTRRAAASPMSTSSRRRSAASSCPISASPPMRARRSSCSSSRHGVARRRQAQGPDGLGRGVPRAQAYHAAQDAFRGTCRNQAAARL
jgi:tartronate-semialdehyde synthase